MNPSLTPAPLKMQAFAFVIAIAGTIVILDFLVSHLLPNDKPKEHNKGKNGNNKPKIK